jgi:hypothetical protein
MKGEVHEEKSYLAIIDVDHITKNYIQSVTFFCRCVNVTFINNRGYRLPDLGFCSKMTYYVSP